MKKSEALSFRRKIEKAAETQSDADALQSIELFQKWEDRIGVQTPVGKRVQDGGRLWECVQLHTPEIGWNPALTPALWREVSLDEWPAWVQPTGAQDAYALGAHVSHIDKHWESLVDNNVWEPGAAGTENLWQEVQ